MVEKEKGCNAANCDKHCSLCYLWVIPEGLVLYCSLRHHYIGYIIQGFNRLVYVVCMPFLFDD